MNKGPEPQSLLPWLSKTENLIRLEIMRTERRETVKKQARGVFHILSDTGPLSQLVSSRLVANNDDTLQYLILQIQKDSPELISRHPWSLTNSDIEALWHQADSFFSSSSGRFYTSFRPKAEEDISPFRSLFYCSKTETFFHPPCPHCGDLLDLCRDDLLLEKVGLKSFSSSLSRYLYCQKCNTQESSPEFYSPIRKSADPEFVKDWSLLVRDLGTFSKAADKKSGLPCIGCSEHSKCFGDQGLALERLAPFSFFPFFMFGHGGKLWPATDFLQKLGGAPGTIKNFPIDGNENSNGFIFKDQPNHSFEILFLKLAFLEQLSCLVLGEEGSRSHPDLCLSLEQIWVEFGENKGLLPNFWNFQLSPLEIGFPLTGKETLPVPPKDTEIFSLGLMWFSVLLANSRQSQTDVLDSLTALLAAEASDAGETPDENEKKLLRQDVFDGVNIFWEPAGKSLPSNFEPYWQQTMSLGLYLVRQGLSEKNDNLAINDFPDQIKKIAKDIRDELFSGVGPMESVQSAPDNDEAIADILEKIVERWTPPPVPDIDEQEEATIIMPSGGMSVEEEINKEPLHAAPPPPKDATEEDFLDRTVILGREGSMDIPVNEKPALKTQVAEEVPPSPVDEEATVILRGVESFPATAEPVVKEPVPNEKEDSDDGLEETIIMDREALQKMLAAKKK